MTTAPSSRHSPVSTNGANKNWSKLILAIAPGHLARMGIRSSVRNHTVTAGAKMPPPQTTIRLNVSDGSVVSDPAPPPVLPLAMRAFPCTRPQADCLLSPVKPNSGERSQRSSGAQTHAVRAKSCLSPFFSIACWAMTEISSVACSTGAQPTIACGEEDLAVSCRQTTRPQDLRQRSRCCRAWVAWPGGTDKRRAILPCCRTSIGDIRIELCVVRRVEKSTSR